jgi:hypothetical protein
VSGDEGELLSSKPLGRNKEKKLNMSAELEIRNHLVSGEYIIWSGIPKQGVLFRPSDIYLIPFSLLWCGFAIFWEVIVLKEGALSCFALFGVPFILIGIYFVLGRFFVDAWLRAKTHYGLTNRRVIIVSGIISRTVESLNLKTLREISVQDRGDHIGTIMFGRPHPFASWYGGMQWPGMGQYKTPSFDFIQDAKLVHDKIIEAQSSAA